MSDDIIECESCESEAKFTCPTCDARLCIEHMANHVCDDDDINVEEWDEDEE